jgi:predicted peroxiredoxin
MMENSQPHTLQILMASGPEALDRAVLGFAFALAATSCGAEVTVVLMQKGTAWAQTNTPEARQTVNGFSSIAEYMDMLAENGALIRLCSSCAERGCVTDSSEKVSTRSLPYAGLVELATRTMQGAAMTVVF